MNNRAMKQIKKLILILFVALIMIVISSCFKDVDSLSPKKTLNKLFTEYRLVCNPERCQGVFGCTPEEFLEKDLELFDEVGDLRKKASIDSETGSLILMFTQPQLTAFKNSDFLTNFDEYKNIEVSSDFKTITVYGYAETINDDYNASILIVEKMIMMQNLNKNDDINVFYAIKDGVTGDLVYLAIIPTYDTYIDMESAIPALELSPLPQ